MHKQVRHDIYIKLLSEEEQEIWEPYYPEEPSPITCGFYDTTEGQFWITLVRKLLFTCMHAVING